MYMDEDINNENQTMPAKDIKRLVEILETESSEWAPK